jgi:hypothetical protein
MEKSQLALWSRLRGFEIWEVTMNETLESIRNRLSVKDVAMKLKGYSNKYPGIDECAITDPLSAYPNLTFLLTPEDE